MSCRVRLSCSLPRVVLERQGEHLVAIGMKG